MAPEQSAQNSPRVQPHCPCPDPMPVGFRERTIRGVERRKDMPESPPAHLCENLVSFRFGDAFLVLMSPPPNQFGGDDNHGSFSGQGHPAQGISRVASRIETPDDLKSRPKYDRVKRAGGEEAGSEQEVSFVRLPG